MQAAGLEAGKTCSSERTDQLRAPQASFAAACFGEAGAFKESAGQICCCMLARARAPDVARGACPVTPAPGRGKQSANSKPGLRTDARKRSGEGAYLPALAAPELMFQLVAARQPCAGDKQGMLKLPPDTARESQGRQGQGLSFFRTGCRRFDVLKVRGPLVWPGEAPAREAALSYWLA